MARFVFNLEGVLTQRRHHEQERQKALAEAQLELTTAEGALRALDADVQGVASDIRDNHLLGVLDLRFISAHRRYAVGMQRKALELAQGIAKAHRAVNEARARLGEAAKARKALETLRETYHARWKQDQDRKELAQLDEAGMQIAFEQITQAEEQTP